MSCYEIHTLEAWRKCALQIITIMTIAIFSFLVVWVFHTVQRRLQTKKMLIAKLVIFVVIFRAVAGD